MYNKYSSPNAEHLIRLICVILNALSIFLSIEIYNLNKFPGVGLLCHQRI